MAHRVGRKDVSDYLNEHALEAAKFVVKSIVSDEHDHIHNLNAKIGAAKLILNKVVPDLKAVEQEISGKLEYQEIVIGGSED